MAALNGSSSATASELIGSRASVESEWRRAQLVVAHRGKLVIIRSNAAEVLASLSRCYRDLLTTESAGPVGCVEIRRDDEGYHLLAGAEVDVRGGSLRDVVEHVHSRIARQLIEASPELLWLHAGAVERGGRSLSFIGPSGSGKSSLAAGLSELGWRYISDDLLALDPMTRELLPFPRMPAVREPSSQELPPERLWELTKQERWIDPAGVCRQPVPAATLIFPRFSPGASSHLERCAPLDATVTLLKNCQNLHMHREAAVRCLADLARTVDAFHLRYGDRDDAVTTVSQAAAQWLVSSPEPAT